MRMDLTRKLGVAKGCYLKGVGVDGFDDIMDCESW